MMPFISFVYVVLLLAMSLVNFGDTYEKCRWQMTDMKLAPTDSVWFKKAAEKGFYVVEHGDCNNCEGEEAFAWLKPSGRSTRQKLCFFMNVVTKFGPYRIPLNCQFNIIEDQECEIDFSSTNLADKLRWQGTLKFISTDNSTYVAGTTCLLGKENFYWIITTNPERKLKPGVYEELMKLFDHYGFKGNNIAVKGTSPFFFEEMSAQNC